MDLGTRARTDRTWLRAGIAVAAVGWGANQFAPLLLLYRTELGLSATALTATFGLYAAGLVPGLLLGGPLSDHRGRRPVLLAALVTSVLGTVLLIAGGTAPTLLYAGRLVAGVASGAAFSSGTAWIKELSAPGTGPRRATVAMTTGFAAGPLVAGLLAQWSPAPTVTAYLPHLALTLLALPLTAVTPETSARDQTRPANGMGGVRERRFRTVVVPLAPWVFGSASIALAYLPSLVQAQLGDNALLFAAVVTTTTALAGIAVQPLVSTDAVRPRKWRESRTTSSDASTALAVVVAGLLVAAAAAGLKQPVLMLMAAVVLGAGYGYCQVCGLREVQRLARADELARMTAAYQAISYTGFAVPFLLAAARRLADPAVLLLVTAGLAGLTQAWTARRTKGDADE